jgi:hypothetical protein
MLPVKPGNSFFLPDSATSLLALHKTYFPPSIDSSIAESRPCAPALFYFRVGDSGCALQLVCCSLSVGALGGHARRNSRLFPVGQAEEPWSRARASRMVLSAYGHTTCSKVAKCISSPVGM